MTQTSRVLACAVALAAFCSATTARAEDYYVAPAGDDDNPGTLAAPFATVERAQSAASAGDTVLIRGGVYAFSGTSETIGVSFTKSGAPDQPIRYFAYPGETPIFDLFELTPQQRVTGLDVHCSWVHIRGLEVRGVRQLIVGDSWGVRVRGDHNVIEHLHVHDNEAPGIFITSGASNLILNCDSHHNYDPLEGGGNADGFGCHSSGQGNVLRGCRAWENSDDGFDFINAAGACTVEQSWAFRNGWIPDTETGVGNGAGFKSGGYGNPPNTPATGAARHVVRFNVAFRNRAIGFYANYHPGGIDFLNNTAFDNPSNFDMRTAGGTSSHTLRNNIATGTGHDIVSFTGGTEDFNAWTLPVTVSNDDFVSLDTMQAYGARNADGSLPSMTLAHLREDSDLIDKGQDIDFAFAGSAPDLGAFEVGLEPPPMEPMEPADGGTADGGMMEPDSSSTAGAGGGGAAAGASGGDGTAGMNAMQPGVAGEGTAMMQPEPAGAMSVPPVGTAGAAPDGAAPPSGGCSVSSSRCSTPAAWLMVCALFTWLARTRRRASNAVLSTAITMLMCIGTWACSSDSGDPSASGGQGGALPAAGAGGASGVGGAGGVAGASAGAAGAAGIAGAGAGGAAGTIAGASAGAGGAGGASNGGAEAPDDMTDGGPDADTTPTDPNGLWIATDGSDDNPGTEAMPFATLDRAVANAAPGLTIWIKPGTYPIAETVRLPADGTQADPIRIFAAPGARPVLDFSAQPRGDSSARGVQISGTYWHLRGLDVINAGDNCIHISGSHNTIELVNTYGCSDTGVQITANSADAADATRAAYNTVINCDSHDNYDEANAGENADGFAAKLYIGPGNVFRGCRAWNNADDGWDFFASDDVVVVDHCWAISNGKIGPAQNNTNGDGNGFKLGGAAKAGDANMGGAVHEVTSCVSIENRACGFVRNNNTLEPELSMCGGRGDGKGLLCSLSTSGAVTVTTSAAAAIAAERASDGSLPPLP